MRDLATILLIAKHLTSTTLSVDSVHGRPPFRPCTERKVAGDGKESARVRSPGYRPAVSSLPIKRMGRRFYL